MICLVGEDCGWFVRITRIDPSKANTPAFGAVPESRAQPERGGYRAAIGARAQVRALAIYRSGRLSGVERIETLLPTKLRNDFAIFVTILTVERSYRTPDNISILCSNRRKETASCRYSWYRSSG